MRVCSDTKPLLAPGPQISSSSRLASFVTADIFFAVTEKHILTPQSLYDDELLLAEFAEVPVAFSLHFELAGYIITKLETCGKIPP